MYKTLSEAAQKLKERIIPNADWYILCGQGVNYAGYMVKLVQADYHRPVYRASQIRSLVHITTLYLNGRAQHKNKEMTVQKYLRMKEEAKAGIDSPKVVWWLYEASEET